MLLKIANLHDQLSHILSVRESCKEILKQWPLGEAAVDAKDKLWLLEKPDRLLMTLVTPSVRIAYLDGRKIQIDGDCLAGIPAWGERTHYRYGREYAY